MSVHSTNLAEYFKKHNIILLCLGDILCLEIIYVVLICCGFCYI